MSLPKILLLLFISLSLISSKSTDYERHLELSLLFYEAQRAGPLPKDNRIYWRHDSLLEAGSDVGTDLTGGYFDAGDNVIFNFPGASAMTLLAWSGIAFGDAYKKAKQWDQLLSTIKWETDYFLKCHPNSDVLYCGVGEGNIDHDHWYPPEYVNYEYPTCVLDKNHPGSDVAGEMAATLAASSILFKDEDEEYSNTLLKGAKSIFEFGNKYKGKYKNADDFYPSYDYKDELAWASAWLYKATGDEKYFETFEKYNDFEGYEGPITWDDKNAGYGILIAEITGEDEYLEAAYDYCDSILKTSKTKGGLYFVEGLSDWASNCEAANAAAILAIFASILPESDEKRQKYINFVEKQINYILGDNPMGVNYVVGAEDNSPKSVHHAACSGASSVESDPKENIFTLYGALAGGPGSDDKWEDSREDYERNEVALDYNAGFTLDLAALIHFGLGKKDSGDILDFERAWPPKAPTPNIGIKINSDENSIGISTGSGMKCSSWCISFSFDSKITVKSGGRMVKKDMPDYTVCNQYNNNYLDGKGKVQTVKFNIEDNDGFEDIEEFEVLCDGYNAHEGEGEPAYLPENGHLYKVSGKGGKDNTEPMFEQSECWPSFLCE